MKCHHFDIFPKLYFSLTLQQFNDFSAEFKISIVCQFRSADLRYWGVRASRVGLGGIALAASLVALNSCTQGPLAEFNKKEDALPNAADIVHSTDLSPRSPTFSKNVDTGGSNPAPVTFFGEPAPVAASAEQRVSDEKSGFTLNFENTPVATVAKTVLGDILGVGYVIDPRAQGTISLSSGRPIPKKDMLFVLENALRSNNLVMVRDASGYRIAPANEGNVGGVDRASADSTTEPGYGMTVIPVQFVSGQTLARLLEGFAARPGAIRTDPSGSLLIVLGSGAERQSAVETVRSFDVDWLRGQSVGIYPVHNSAPEPVVAELEKIMDSGDTGVAHNLVKFVVVTRQNAVMVVASKPELLKTAAMWISRLDASSTASTGVKVYRVKYGDAKQIAQLLNDMFGAGGGGGGLSSPVNDIAPGSGATTLSTVERLTGGAQAQPAQTQVTAVTRPGSPSDAQAGRPPGAATGGLARSGAGGGAGGGGAGVLPGVRITPDIANNAILIYADQQNYNIIARALDQIDRPKLQVAIDVTIAEVTLTDDLAYGVQFYLASKYGSIFNSSGTATLASAAAPALAPTLPGFNLVAGSPQGPGLVLNALHKLTKVKILSNPSLVVVDNQEATLEVGDQVPVSTGSATVLSANNAVVNTVDYKNTGIILHVQPRVNSNGQVLLDIQQEISSVPQSSSPNLTPTISERKVKSELSVASGQTVLLAGLISETQNDSHGSVPLLDQLPIIGKAFGSHDTGITRTELIIFIRPQIIRNGADASTVAEELRSKMRGGKIGSVGAPDLFPKKQTNSLQ